MGFRDLEGFNLALLARQGWRLIQTPDSLLARLLKARYFPSSTFLKARVGYTPSCMWRSLLRGWEILDKGCVWMVGSGANIDIQTNPRIPLLRNFRPTLSRTDDVHLPSRVIDLIDWSTSRWREEEIMSMFDDREAREICNIHLIDPGVLDNIIWNEDASGIYSVKSGYKVHMIEKKIRNRNVGSSDPSIMARLWLDYGRLYGIQR